jgi:hypothetical protein
MKGFGLILFGALAVISGIVIAVMLIRKKRRDSLLDFDDFDTAVSDEEFEHFFGSESAENKDTDD